MPGKLKIPHSGQMCSLSLTAPLLEKDNSKINLVNNTQKYKWSQYSKEEGRSHDLLGGSLGVRLIVSLTGLTGGGRTDASNDALGSPMADMFTNGLPGLCLAHIGRSVGPPRDLLSLDIDFDFCNENSYV